MIPDYNRYYGCVFVQLLEQRPKLVVEKMSVDVQGFYLLERSLPLYVKFSRSRRGPWGFNFQAEHQFRCDELAKQFGTVVTALVCGADGIVALDHQQLREVLDSHFDDQEGVTVRRKLGQMYSVTGKDGKLARKISRDSLAVVVDGLLAPRAAAPIA